MGGDQRGLAAVVEQAADLPDLEPVAQFDALLREGGLCLSGTCRAEDGHRKPVERRRGPVLPLESLCAR